MFLTGLTSEALSLDHAKQFIQSVDCGAEVFFTGTVRNHNEGKVVRSLEYSAYEPMAKKMLDDFAVKALSSYEISRVYLFHRIGHLQLTDASILIAISAHHRDAAYKANRFLIEEIKHHLPVWKKEHYTGEVASWVRCSHQHHHEGHSHD